MSHFHDRYYFAYGSNLDAEDLHEYGAGHGHGADSLKRVVGVGTLERYRLVFGRYSRGRGGGVLDVWATPDGAVPDGAVPGVVFEVDDAELELLDRKEGHPKYYQRTAVSVLVRGSYLEAIAYIGRPDQRRLTRPQADYLAIVRRGYEAHQLPLDALERAILQAEAAHD